MLSISGRSAKLGIAVGTILLLVVAGGVASVFPTASNEGYAPAQPIPYSHRLHAGELKIPCLYCHSGAEKSKHASIPALNVCMNCHRVVKTDSPYIKQITQAYVEGKPIEWVRVHELPDYVYFPHKRHVAKGVSCQTCHGQVQEMDRVAQFAPLTMGWCMECHRGQTTPKNVLQKIYPNMKDPHGPVAPVNCSTCHK
jgi:Cytochrome c7 and related cytochrome c